MDLSNRIENDSYSAAGQFQLVGRRNILIRLATHKATLRRSSLLEKKKKKEEKNLIYLQIFNLCYCGPGAKGVKR